MQQLSDELFLQIFSEISYANELFNASRTCQRFYRILCGRTFMWRMLPRVRDPFSVYYKAVKTGNVEIAKRILESNWMLKLELERCSKYHRGEFSNTQQLPTRDCLKEKCLDTVLQNGDLDMFKFIIDHKLVCRFATNANFGRLIYESRLCDG